MKWRTGVAWSVVAASIAGVLFKWGRTGSPPVLVLKGIEQSGTNKVAKFELRNTSGRSLWLLRTGGTPIPDSDDFMEKPLVAPPPLTNPSSSNVYSLYAGDFWFVSEEVKPGSSLALDFRIRSNQAPEEVGICYYVGNFKDGVDFCDQLMIPGWDGDASLNEKIQFLWKKSKRYLIGPKDHEVWCATPLSSTNGVVSVSSKLH